MRSLGEWPERTPAPRRGARFRALPGLSRRACVAASRVGFGLLLLCLSPLAAEPTVTLKIDREPVAAVARLISKQAGVPIRVTGAGDKEVVRLEVEGPVEKVLGIVSRVVGMEVRKEGNGYVLAPLAGAAPAKPASAPVPVLPSDTVARVKRSVALVLAYLPAEHACAQGTGFVISPDGLIATDAHVIKGASAIEVSLPQNVTYVAVVAASDDDTDLAVLRVAAPFREYLRPGDSDRVREGDDAAVTGYPMALDLLRHGIPLHSSTTKATVSAVRPGKSAVTGATMPLIQLDLDAPLNPGYSGGPLFRRDTGEVVGVLQFKVHASQAPDTGVSFSVPINRVRPLVAKARANPVAPPADQAPQMLAGSIPMPLRPAPGPGADAPPGTPQVEELPALTRTFDLLPAAKAAAVPEPGEVRGLIPLYGVGGKMLADPARPRLYVADTERNGVVVMDTEKEQVIRRVLTGPKPHGLAAAADGKVLYVAHSGGSDILLLDLDSLEPLGRIPVSFRPFDLALGPEGRLYATPAAPERSALRAIDLHRQTELAVGGQPLEGGALVAAVPSKQTVFTAEPDQAPGALFRCAGSSKLGLADIADPRVAGAGIRDLALSPDGSLLYVANCLAGVVWVLNAADLRPAGRLDVPAAPAGVALSPDGQTAYVWHDDRVDRFDRRTFERTGTLVLPRPPLRLVVSPDSKKLFIRVAGGILIRDAGAVGAPAPAN